MALPQLVEVFYEGSISGSIFFYINSMYFDSMTSKLKNMLQHSTKSKEEFVTT